MSASDFKVGLFTLFGIGVIAFGWVWSSDGLRPGEEAYRVSVLVPSADGLWEGTAVRIAGVEVGAIEAISVQGGEARLVLAVRSEWQLPTDTVASVRSAGMLGDRYVALDPGDRQTKLSDGDVIRLGSAPPDLDSILRNAEDISDDLVATADVLRQLAEDRNNTDHLVATLANVDALTAALAGVVERNDRDVDAIVGALRGLSENLEAFTGDLDHQVDDEMASLKSATDRLDLVLENVDAITGKINRGEGTLGALVNDSAIADDLDEALVSATDLVQGFSGLRAEVYYQGRLYAGTQPKDPAFFFGNPVTPSDGPVGVNGGNTLGVSLYPQEDFWWTFEVNDYPVGSLTNEEHFFPETGSVYNEWVRKDSYRFSFLMNKRWFDVAFRLGILEDGGGAGIAGFLWRDRLRLSADVFDFGWGSYPALESSGLPNLRLAARVEPARHLWFEAGAEQVLLGARYGYATGFVGVGFHFADDDIKLLVSSLPVGP